MKRRKAKEFAPIDYRALWNLTNFLQNAKPVPGHDEPYLIKVHIDGYDVTITGHVGGDIAMSGVLTNEPEFLSTLRH